MSLKKNNYLIVKNILSKELNELVLNYILFKRQAVDIMYQTNFAKPNSTLLGTYTDPQMVGTYSHYGDFLTETLLIYFQKILEKKLKLKLVPTYSYFRIYKKGDVLKKHNDRPSCEISATLNVAGDPWEFFLENVKKGIILNHTDMLIYKGNKLKHWRNEFKGNMCIQIFFHFNDLNGPFKTKNLYDTRPFLGLPSEFCKEKSD